MYEKDVKFDPIWTPPSYPGLNPKDAGVWRYVLDDDNEPVGVVWSNQNDASGVLWITQTDDVTKLYKYFAHSAEAKIPATIAYLNAESLTSATLGTEIRGKLSGVDDALDVIAEDIDEASS